MSTSDPTSRGERLDGWKQIASYLGRGIRTVQRWETELAMPVRRMGTGAGETVHAFTGELDAWRARQERTTTAGAGAGDGQHEGGTLGVPDRDAARQEREDSAAAAAGDTSREHSAFDPSSAGDGPLSSSLPESRVLGPAPTGRTDASSSEPGRLTLVVFGVVVALILLAGGYTVLRPGSGSPAMPASPGQPARGAVRGGVLEVRDESGRLLWQKDGRDFGVALTDAFYEEPLWFGRPTIVCHDIDADGLVEVLLAAEPEAVNSAGLFCFEYDGRLRFRHQAAHRVRYEHLDAAPPWRVMRFAVMGEPGKPHDIWVVSSHLQEFPTVVERLDARGRPTSAYWNNGYVSALHTAEIAGVPVVLIGGCSNEFMGGTLAVLDRRDPTGTAPAVNAHYACQGCPPRAPMAFLVFPRLDVTAAVENYAPIDRIDVDAAGQILVQLLHATGDVVSEPEMSNLSRSLYVVGPDFRVVKAEIGPQYPLVHRLLEERGLLKRPFSLERDSRGLFPVRRWAGDRFEMIRSVEDGKGRPAEGGGPGR